MGAGSVLPAGEKRATRKRFGGKAPREALLPLPSKLSTRVSPPPSRHGGQDRRTGPRAQSRLLPGLLRRAPPAGRGTGGGRPFWRRDQPAAVEFGGPDFLLDSACGNGRLPQGSAGERRRQDAALRVPVEPGGGGRPGALPPPRQYQEPANPLTDACTPFGAAKL